MAKSRLNSKDVSRILERKKRNKLFRSFVIVLAAFVMAITSFSLSETGITMTADALNENVGASNLLGDILKKITKTGDTYTISGEKGWEDLCNLINNDEASGTYNVVVDGPIAADRQITVKQGVTLNLSGTNNGTVYVASTASALDEVFLVDGGTLNLSNVTLSGKLANFEANTSGVVCGKVALSDPRMQTYSQVSYTPSEWTVCNNVVTTNSKITADLGRNGRLSINNLVMHCIHGSEVVQNGGGIFAGNSEDQIIVARPTDSPTDASGGVSVGAGGVYYIRGGVGSQEYYYLELTSNGARWRDEQAFLGSTNKSAYQWTYKSDGTMRNGNKFLYLDGSQVYVTDVPTGTPGCTPELISSSALYAGEQQVYANVNGTGTSALSKTPGTNITVYKWKEENGKIVRDIEVRSLEDGSYYFIGVGGTGSADEKNLHAEGNDTKWDHKPTSGTNKSEIRKLWKYTNGILVNEATNQMIYFNGSDELLVVSQTTEKDGPPGCIPENEWVNGSWVPNDSLSINDKLTSATKGFLIAADNNGKVNLNSGSSVQDMNYTGSQSGVAPIYMQNGAELTIDGGTIKNNHVTMHTNANNSDVSYKNNISETTANESNNIRLNRKKLDDGTYSAGAVLLDEGGKATFKNGSIESNTGIAGAVYVKNGTFTQDGGTIGGGTDKGNHSYKGAIVIDGEKSQYDFNNGSVAGNDSATYGGGFTVQNQGILNVGVSTQGSPTISGNKTLDQGGGIFVGSNNVTLKKALIENNVSHFMGGGIYVNGGDDTDGENNVLVLDKAYVTQNKAGNGKIPGITLWKDQWSSSGNYGEGGGIWNCNWGSIIMDATKIRMWNNDADGNGNEFYNVGKWAGRGIISEFITEEYAEFHDTTTDKNSKKDFGPYPN